MTDTIAQIYSSWGCRVELVAYCGKHKPNRYTVPCVLLKAIRKDDEADKFYFMNDLRCEGGLNAIEKVVDGLPQLSLTKEQLRNAIKNAS